MLETFFPMLAVVLSARRMGLRDKGPTESFYEDGAEIHWVHTGRCNTWTRIGIDKGGDAVEYCWKCETLVEIEDEEDEGGDDDDGERAEDDKKLLRKVPSLHLVAKT